MHLLVFGLGYTARRLTTRLAASGWTITATSRAGAPGTYAIGSSTVADAVQTATHILTSIPPVGGEDIVLRAYSNALQTVPAKWIGYLSSTGVYGDTSGSWVDETAELGGRRAERIAADRAWQALGRDVYIFRLPGIYGPGRSVIDQLRAGTAHRVDAPGQRFSRIHVDDIGNAIIASFDNGAPGIYNLADDAPASAREVVEYGCRLIRAPVPELIAPDSPRLSPVARGFYTESRLVTARKSRRSFGLSLSFPDYRAGLRALLS